jgi:endonuclease/exonuclease/phosphatase (EEP) superfamily protein YafD
MKKRKQSNLTLKGMLDICAAGLWLATLLGLLGRLFWFFDLFSHFRVQYMQMALVLIGIALWQRLNKRAVVLIVLACLNYAFVLPLYFGKSAPPAAEKPIRVMLMNILARNGNTEQVLAAINQADPDLLLLEEVTPDWAHELKVLDADYPYRIDKPQVGCFGIMLLSKHPLERGQIIQIGEAGVPSIITEAHLPGGVISILGTHPLPPAGAEYSTQRNLQLMELPTIVKGQKHPVLLIGDLNTSPFSYWFRRLVTEAGLKNSMKGFGYQPTWPSHIPFLRIPLDHVLHSPDITIHNRMVGSNVGSDHLPVIIDFTIN